MQSAAVLCLHVDQQDRKSWSKGIDRLLLSLWSGQDKNGTPGTYGCLDYSLDICMHTGQHVGLRAWLMPSHVLQLK